MQIEDIVGVRFGIGNEVDMEDGNRGWNLEDIAGDSLSAVNRRSHGKYKFCYRGHRGWPPRASRFIGLNLSTIIICTSHQPGQAFGLVFP
jgi:hypothetical protein